MCDNHNCLPVMFLKNAMQRHMHSKREFHAIFAAFYPAIERAIGIR